MPDQDRRIRYRANEIGALRTGHVLCLADGSSTRAEATRRFIDALPAIERGVARHDIGSWHVHANGVVRRTWPMARR